MESALSTLTAAHAAASIANLTVGNQAMHQLLAESYSWFTEGFDTADLQAAKALLEELGF